MKLQLKLQSCGVALVAIASAAAGCEIADRAGTDAGAATQSALGSAAEDIENGYIWDPWTETTETWTRNVVELNLAGAGCTGTLLNYEWVMTAGHCFEYSPTLSEIHVSHQLADGTTETSVAAEAHTDPDGLAQPDGSNDGVDIALIRLATPMHPGVSTLPLYSGTVASLTGQSVFCAGYGATAVGAACGSGLPACPSGQSCDRGSCLTDADGVLHEATFTIIADPDNPTLPAPAWYRFDVPNGDGQMELPGDSGSTCWNGSALTGVDKAGNYTDYNRQTAIPAGRTWIDSYVAPTEISEINRPGAKCTPVLGATVGYNSTGGITGGASGANVICPLDRSIAPTAATYASAPDVWVDNESSSGEVCCHLYSSNPDGTDIVGGDSCTSGTGAQTLTLASVYDTTTFSQFAILCTLPAASAGGVQSSLDTYRVAQYAR